MLGNINFRRYGRESKSDGFVYSQDDNSRDYDNNPHVVSLENVGFNLHVTIKNFMAEPVMLGANVRSQPTRIASLLKENVRQRHDTQNYVMVTIYSTENALAPNGKSQATKVRKTEIRIPGYMLNQGSVFVDELDCYLTTESNIDATRELIARDIEQEDHRDTINVPTTLINQDPGVIYHEYRSLVDLCLKRQDKMQIRVGVDLEHDIIPDTVRNLHVAILDHYFVPFTYHKLVFDPSLSHDEFVIENLHLSSREQFRYRFSQLARDGAMYLSHDEQDTLMGKFYAMALFSNHAQYLNYLFKRKAIERFKDETLFLAERSGDPRLKEEIHRLERERNDLQESLQAREVDVTNLEKQNKRLAGDLKDREQTIQRIRTHHDENMSADVVLQGMYNEQLKIKTEGSKIENDRREQEQRTVISAMGHKATVLKTIADMMKSTWGIIAGISGGILSIVALLKKYNVRLTMSP